MSQQRVYLETTTASFHYESRPEPNCAHLANTSKLAHIIRINGLLGLYVPSLVTPLGMPGAPPDED